MEYSINGLKIFTKGNKSKKPIVFVHGFPYDHSMWENQIETLKENYYCISYDVRGLGESYIGDGQYTMEAFVWDLYSILDNLHIDNPILCGLSMGGYVALRAVEKEKNRFSGLILCDTRAEADDNEGKIKRSNAIDKINVEGLDSFVNDFIPICFHPKAAERIPETIEQQLKIAQGHNSLGIKGSILAMVSRRDTTKSLKKIKIPVLVLVGKKDTLTPPEVMKKMAEKIKNSKFFIVPKAGHMAPLENPEFVNEKIENFLNKYFPQ